MKVNLTMTQNIQDPVYGPKFRELRNRANKNLTETATGITSKSSLDRWEKGNDNLSFSKVIDLLQRIGIQPNEFLESNVPSRLYFLYYKPMVAYKNNDLAQLKELIIEYANDLDQKENKRISLFQYAISCNAYEDLTGKSVISDFNQKRICNYFRNLEHWTYENIFLFLSIQLLLSPTLLIKLSNSLISYSKNNRIDKQKWYPMLLESIINAIFVLLKFQKASDAKIILGKYQTLPMDDRYTFERIRVNFMSALIDYTSTKDNSHISSLLLSIQNLGLDHLYSDLKFAANQIFNLY